MSATPTPAPAAFSRPITLEEATARHRNTAIEHLGIEFLQIGPDRLVGRMPVDARTTQPMGLLHGGASVLLAESLGSFAANLSLPPGQAAVGLDINANHLRGVRSGWVTGDCRPVHLGRSTQVWQIEIRDEQGRLTCTSRLTMAVIEVPGAGSEDASKAPRPGLG